MDAFVYVFSEDARDRLLAMQYTLMKSDEERGIFMFLNKETTCFSQSEFPYVTSNIITF